MSCTNNCPSLDLHISCPVDDPSHSSGNDPSYWECANHYHRIEICGNGFLHCGSGHQAPFYDWRFTCHRHGYAKADRKMNLTELERMVIELAQNIEQLMIGKSAIKEIKKDRLKKYGY